MLILMSSLKWVVKTSEAAIHASCAADAFVPKLVLKLAVNVGVIIRVIPPPNSSHSAAPPSATRESARTPHAEQATARRPQGRTRQVSSARHFTVSLVVLPRWPRSVSQIPVVGWLRPGDARGDGLFLVVGRLRPSDAGGDRLFPVVGRPRIGPAGGDGLLLVLGRPRPSHPGGDALFVLHSPLPAPGPPRRPGGVVRRPTGYCRRSLSAFGAPSQSLSRLTRTQPSRWPSSASGMLFATAAPAHRTLRDHRKPRTAGAVSLHGRQRDRRLRLAADDAGR